MVFALAGDSTITSVLAITTFLARKRGLLDQLLWGAITDYLNLRRLENGPGRGGCFPSRGPQRGGRRRRPGVQGPARPQRALQRDYAWLPCRKNPAGPST